MKNVIEEMINAIAPIKNDMKRKNSFVFNSFYLYTIFQFLRNLIVAKQKIPKRFGIFNENEINVFLHT